MNDSLFIGIDIGTQGTKAVLTDITGNALAEAFCPSVLIRPDAVTVYEEAETIFESVVGTIGQVIERSGRRGKDVAAIGIDSQMAGVMGIDGDFEAVTPYDSWLDTRCEKYTSFIKSEAEEEAIRSSGGQVAHTHASKILWWKNEHPQVYSRIKKFVMPNGYVAGKLCGLKSDDAFMDYTFLHFNVFSDNLKLEYSDALLKHFGVEKRKLPKIVSPEFVVGTVREEYACACGLGTDCKVIAGCGDTAASSLGAGVVGKGLAYDVAGTASVFACSTDVFAPDVSHKTILFSRSVFKDMFLPLSYISGGGLCLKWFSGICGKTLKELDALVAEDEEMEVPFFIPHFSGRTYPLDNGVSGAFIGLNANSDATKMYRSILESIAFEYKSYFDILKDSGCLTTAPTVIGVGGGAKSAAFSKIKATVLGCRYVIPASADSATVAMALLAAKACGYITEDLSEVFGVDESNSKVFVPNRELQPVLAQKAGKYLGLLNGYSDFFQRQ